MNKEIKIDASKAFQFIAVNDCGDTCCPHCGADGRYVYVWAEYGEQKAAMAGCYQMLTGRLQKDDVAKHIERLSVKQAKGKPLNGWDKTVLRMLDYAKENAGDSNKVAWAQGKIKLAVAEARTFQAKHFR